MRLLLTHSVCWTAENGYDVQELIYTVNLDALGWVFFAVNMVENVISSFLVVGYIL